MIKAINQSAKNGKEVSYASCTHCDPRDVCVFCDTRDTCSSCDAEWCDPFVLDN